jgi:hypothetical protein
VKPRFSFDGNISERGDEQQAKGMGQSKSNLLDFVVLRFITSGTSSSFGIVKKSYYMIYGKTVKEEI